MTIQYANERAFTRPRPAGRAKRPLAILGAAALALPLILQGTAAQAVSFAPTDAIAAITSGTTTAGYQEEFLQAVNSQNIWNHDVHLADTIGPRVAGTPGEEAAAAYIEQTLTSYGFDTSRESFAATAQLFADVTPSRYQDGYASWQFRPASNAVVTGADAPVADNLVDIGGATADLAERTDLAGAIVLADWNTSAAVRSGVLTDLAAAGAIGVVFAKSEGISSPEALPNVGAVPAEAQGLVVVGAALNQGARMRALIADGPLSLSIATQVGGDTSTNVLGVRKAANGDPDAPIVYIGAHIDTVVGSHGASDNGSGSSIMLELARILGSYSLNTEVRVGAWGAEEQGIKGSKHHASTVMTPEDRDRTIGAWNMDMAGTGHPGDPGQEFGFWALTVDGDTVAENPVLELADEVSKLAGHGDLQVGQVGRSDHQSFRDVGIPAAVFSWMFWAGGTNIVLEPAYHQTTDTLEFVSEERMAIAAQILGGSVFRAALEEVTIEVTDEQGDPAVGAQLALSCDGENTWRDAGVTGDTGSATTHVPNATCDVVALAADGARGSVAAVEIAADPTVKIEVSSDAIAPEVIAEVSPATPASQWHTSAPVNVTLSATDNADDAPVLESSLNGADWAVVTEATVLTTDGLHTIAARATDDFGNQSDELETSVGIDTVGPELSVAVVPEQRGQLEVASNDATSGVARVEYQIKNVAASSVAAMGAESWQLLADGEDLVDNTVVAAITLPNGQTSVAVRALDVAGNVSEVAEVTVAAAPTSSTPPAPIPTNPPTTTPTDPTTTDPTTTTTTTPSSTTATGTTPTQSTTTANASLSQTGGMPLVGAGAVGLVLLLTGGAALTVRRRQARNAA
ncbi:hypothetical protein JOF28_000633 [Leucobacter exalbidus]|uniref:Peptidase M28 domain-containing protein n=1 Tax=Leucobacter exalbidus TaxID=662960 RepID=A0A940PUD5_9MICO|nr:M28 family peptidase [Leucobacter exalbidus]MBP1325401.1 hypothetical protein [Leucobacter exalbidus]